MIGSGKQNRIRIYLFAALFAALLFLPGGRAKAAVVNSGSCTLYCYDSESIEFRAPISGVITINVDVRRSGTDHQDTLNILLEKEDPDFYDYDQVDADDLVMDSADSNHYTTWYYGSQTAAAGSAYRYTLSYDNDSDEEDDNLEISYSVEISPSFSTGMNIPQTVSLKTYQTYDLRGDAVPSDSVLQITDMYSSDRSIVDFNGYGEDSTHYSVNEIETTGKPGTAILTFTLENGARYQTQVNVEMGKPCLKWTSVTNYHIGDKVQNQLLNRTGGKVRWTTSNKKVATVTSKGKIVMRGIGKCTITAKYKGKKYKCKVKVVRQKPDFFAYITDYNTRNNYFKVRVTNYSNKPVYFYSSGAKVKEDDYKTFDRRLRLKSSRIKVKAHKSATLRYYVIGYTTWYNHEDYTLFGTFRFDGKNYQMKVRYEDSFYKVKKKWYNTYSDD